VVGKYPPPYLAPFLNSPKSIWLEPQMIFYNYSEENN
jgi:hypothetical protein